MSRRIVDAWLEASDVDTVAPYVPDIQKDGLNVNRAFSYLQLQQPEDPSQILEGFVTVRIQPSNDPLTLKKGIRSKGVTIMVSLSGWDKNNGCPLEDVELYPGDDIVLHGTESVTFPGSGGGIVTLIFLHSSQS